MANDSNGKRAAKEVADKLGYPPKPLSRARLACGGAQWLDHGPYYVKGASTSGARPPAILTNEGFLALRAGSPVFPDLSFHADRMPPFVGNVNLSLFICTVYAFR